uniref:Uncharacterized protein n=1 Tax=Bosea sp. NBC_00436 TaxID=2969620 RepID=A0A9E8CR83_9HYPH
MSNYSQCRAFLINAFLALDDETPEDARLQRAIELVLEAVARTERDARPSNVVRFPAPSNPTDVLRVRKPGP